MTEKERKEKWANEVLDHSCFDYLKLKTKERLSLTFNIGSSFRCFEDLFIAVKDFIFNFLNVLAEFLLIVSSIVWYPLSVIFILPVIDMIIYRKRIKNAKSILNKED